MVSDKSPRNIFEYLQRHFQIVVVLCFIDPSIGFILRLINRKTYTILYGAAGCIYSASNRYFNATISTLEKRFKIPSKNIGFISAGNDISQTIAAVALTYLVAGKNKPRWMSYALYGIAMYCFVSALPHFIYGPGDDALRLTKEYGEDWMLNTTELIVLKEKRKLLCNANGRVNNLDLTR